MNEYRINYDEVLAACENVHPEAMKISFKDFKDSLSDGAFKMLSESFGPDLGSVQINTRDEFEKRLLDHARYHNSITYWDKYFITLADIYEASNLVELLLAVHGLDFYQPHKKKRI